MSKPKALIAWSSGKDSAWALHKVRRAGEYEVVGALTTVTETFGRVSMHGVREEILRTQHAAIGLPSVIVPIPYPCPNEIYEARLAAVRSCAAGRLAGERGPMRREGRVSFVRGGGADVFSADRGDSGRDGGAR